jgi:hypothetical protein
MSSKYIENPYRCNICNDFLKEGGFQSQFNSRGQVIFFFCNFCSESIKKLKEGESLEKLKENYRKHKTDRDLEVMNEFLEAHKQGREIKMVSEKQTRFISCHELMGLFKIIIDAKPFPEKETNDMVLTSSLTILSAMRMQGKLCSYCLDKLRKTEEKIPGIIK